MIIAFKVSAPGLPRSQISSPRETLVREREDLRVGRCQCSCLHFARNRVVLCRRDCVQIDRSFPWRRMVNHKTAIFRQINKQRLVAHHDALEFPDGQVMLLTLLCEGQQATVLQLPRQPKTTEDAANLGRAAYAG